MRAVLVVLLVLSLTLAGCGGGGGKKAAGPAQLKDGKGAIAGLVINDVYRPVPRALVLLSNGVTATADGNGQFTVLDLEPGSYILRVQAEGHEAAPQTVDVVEGEYTDAELLARRVFNQGGRIVTTEYSVFIPCSFGGAVTSGNPPCLVDLSGDSDRSYFFANYTAYANVTYLVTEMRADRPASTEPGGGSYKIVVRDSRGGDPYFSSAFTSDSSYLKLVMKMGAVSEQDAEHRNQRWNNTDPLQVVLFPQGSFKGESQGAMDQACTSDPSSTTCQESKGVGAQFGIRARFVQSLFIGKPGLDIDNYGVLD